MPANDRDPNPTRGAPTHAENQAVDPGRTPGQAEGGEEATQAQEPGKTPGQAEGERGAVEEALRGQGKKQDAPRGS